MSTILLIYTIATVLASSFVRLVREAWVKTFKTVKKRWQKNSETESKLKRFGLTILFILRVLLLFVLLLILILPLSPLLFITAERRLKNAKKKEKQLESKIAIETNEAKRKKYEANLAKLKDRISATDLFNTFDELKKEKKKPKPAIHEQDILY